MNSEQEFLNLDYLAAKHAQAIITALSANNKPSEVDNLVTKSLGVLTEDGVFAAFIFMKSHKEQQIAESLVDELLKLAHEVYADMECQGRSAQTVLNFVSEKITIDLDRLILCKAIFEKTLIYARYSVKAWDQECKAAERKRKEKEEKDKEESQTAQVQPESGL